MIITIDGASCSGKGSVSSKLADYFHFSHLDSGALYRGFAFWIEQQGVASDDVHLLEQQAKNMPFHFNQSKFLLAEEDVTELIRGERVGSLASQLAIYPQVRAALLDRQRNFHYDKGLVADGRDMGTVVFPQAECKIFLKCDARIRAERRLEQLRQKGKHGSIDSVLADIMHRDERDTFRNIAPLMPADDVMIIDSSELSLQDTLNQVIDRCGEKSRSTQP